MGGYCIFEMETEGRARWYLFYVVFYLDTARP